MCKQQKKGIVPILMVLILSVLGGASVAFALQGADSYGYRYIDSDSIGGPKYSWEEIEKIGTDYDTGFDKPEIGARNYMGHAVKIGFNFNFYGRTYSDVYFAGNGYVAFSSATNRNYVYDGSGIPSRNSQNNMIAPFWGWNDTYS